MLFDRHTGFLNLEPADAHRLRQAAIDPLPVSGLTHKFYRYPARFSPLFVRQAIQTFTVPGDTVADPFMGGGTTLVEASALGRYAFGTDISSLATFVARVKTRLYADSDLRRLQAWADGIIDHINMRRFAIYPAEWVERGYLRNLETRRTWRLAKATRQVLATAHGLAPKRVEDLARCVVLRAAQWAMDARKKKTPLNEFRRRLVECSSEMVAGAEQYRAAVEAIFPGKSRLEPLCFNRPASELHKEPLLRRVPRPKLILTSPPYPGVHMLYHRWQVDGRRESPAPFWIANQLDGSGAKYYMLGDHRESDLRCYFDNLFRTFESIRCLCASDTVLVQVVAFSNPQWQLPRYLKVMNAAGFEELVLQPDTKMGDRRLWREVPNRRWHADRRGETSSSNEVVLFHVPIAAKRPRRRCLIDAPVPHRAH